MLPDMWWEEGKLPGLTWPYRVKHWTKSQRRELARRYMELRRDQASWVVTWPGRFSEEVAMHVASIARMR